MIDIKKKLREAGFEIEKAELVKGRILETDYPKPYIRDHITFESFGLSMEEVYFWLLNGLKVDTGYPEIIKITDIFSSSEQSSFWGQQKQRLGLQEDRVMNYMATIGKLLKELFKGYAG